MRGKRAKELRKFGIDKEYYKHGIHIIKIPKKYTTLHSLSEDFRFLTPLERLVYAAKKVNNLREIARILKKSHVYVSKVYERACRKLSRLN